MTNLGRYFLVRLAGRGRRVWHYLDAAGNEPLCGARLRQLDNWALKTTPRGWQCQRCREARHANYQSEHPTNEAGATHAASAARDG
jgi:hypothetical protein